LCVFSFPPEWDWTDARRGQIATFKCLPDLLPSAEILAPFLDAPHGKKEGSTVPTVVLIQ
jgi:hypothetical protein